MDLEDGETSPTAAVRKAPTLRLSFGKVKLPNRAPFDQTWDNHAVQSGHGLVVGGSGSGKTHQLRRMANQFGAAGIKTIVIDGQGDIIPSVRHQTITFGPTSTFGLNPLAVSTDLEMGGVHASANKFIHLIGKQVTLGDQQRTALFRLLMDLYRQHGFSQEDPRTWSLEFDPRRRAPPREVEARPGMVALTGLEMYSVSEAEKLSLRETYSLSFNDASRVWEIPKEHPRLEEAVDQWGKGKVKRPPNLQDLSRHIFQRLKAMKLGMTDSAVHRLEEVCKQARTLQRLRLKRGHTDHEVDTIEARKAKARQAALEAYEEALDRMETGEELEQLLLWDNPDIVRSLYNKVEELLRSGLFKGKAPELDPTVSVIRYNIRGLNETEKKFFIQYLVDDIHLKLKEKGLCEAMDHALLLDEAAPHIDDSSENAVVRAFREARKYGLGLWLFAQELSAFPKPLMASAGARVILGVDDDVAAGVEKKLALQPGKLRYLRPQVTALVQVRSKRGNDFSNRFHECEIAGLA
ncbi:helicase HerA-like domain-containing protein [Azospirillum sp. B4]|uniref:helicase HerA-like domain-containing protein n=1 Tax=Azospirillum sp. B4 TaxID=95605 RepID=UPI000344EBAF|nr:helicase HerA-like domain-containing protein [Azospirillum sp. B4]